MWKTLKKNMKHEVTKKASVQPRLLLKMQASSATATAPRRVEYSEGSYGNAAVEGDAKGLQPKEAPKRRKRIRTCKL